MTTGSGKREYPSRRTTRRLTDCASSCEKVEVDQHATLRDDLQFELPCLALAPIMLLPTHSIPSFPALLEGFLCGISNDSIYTVASESIKWHYLLVYSWNMYTDK